jgi:hypothetical protein
MEIMKPESQYVTCARRIGIMCQKWKIEHFTSFNLVPGSIILDNSFQNDVIFEKQLSTPIVLRK